MSEQPFAEGGCRCGSVTLTIRAKPKMMVQCHCLDCQKTSGTGHTSNAYFAEEDVAVSGDANSHTVIADSGSEMSRYFCPKCGSRLFGFNSNKPGMISVQVGCLENHLWFSPQAVLYTSRRHDWDITNDDIPNFDAMPVPES